MPRKIRCYFGCPSYGSLHHFPKPKYPNLDKFNQWKLLLSKQDQERGNTYIYNNIRFCSHHFEKFYHYPSKRLAANAVPTLNLSSTSRDDPVFEVSTDSASNEPQQEDATLHSIPNPKKFPERFKIWVDLIGGKPETYSDVEFYKKTKVCDIHFSNKHRNRFNRLNALAIPTLHIPGQNLTEETEADNVVKISIGDSEVPDFSDDIEITTDKSRDDFVKDEIAEIQSTQLPGYLTERDLKPQPTDHQYAVIRRVISQTETTETTETPRSEPTRFVRDESNLIRDLSKENAKLRRSLYRYKYACQSYRIKLADAKRKCRMWERKYGQLLLSGGANR